MLRLIKKGWLYIPKTTRSYLKVFLLVTTISLITFGAGTFHPNKWTVGTITKAAEDKMVKDWDSFGFLQPSIEYTNEIEFIQAVGRCVDYLNLHRPHSDRVHKYIIISMAVLETGYGKSRFAHEANNLFGIRTWDPKVPQLKPLENPDAEFGVKKYKTKCDSVQDMVDIINRHSAYEEFRIERAEQLKSSVIDLNKQIDLLNKWSTNPDYTKLVKRKNEIIKSILEEKLAK